MEIVTLVDANFKIIWKSNYKKVKHNTKIIFILILLTKHSVCSVSIHRYAMKHSLNLMLLNIISYHLLVSASRCYRISHHINILFSKQSERTYYRITPIRCSKMRDRCIITDRSHSVSH